MDRLLFRTLENLKQKDFKTFKWYLEKDNILEGQKGIPPSKLEKADRQGTVDTMILKYNNEGALELTKRILKEMDMNKLESELPSSGPKDKVEEGQTYRTFLNIFYTLIGNPWLRKHAAPPADGQTHNRGTWKQAYHHNFVRPPVNHTPKLKTQDLTAPPEEREGRRVAALEDLKRYAVDITLNRNSAHPNLILSEDGKQVHDSDLRQQLPYDRRRFTTCVSVLGEQGFSSGRFYFEVQVRGKTAWTLGVAAESIERKGEINVAPDDGFWTIRLRNRDDYTALNNHLLYLTLSQQLYKVGVFVDYEGGLVSFYNADTADQLYSFTGCHFTEKLFPYISPCCNYGGINSAPLIISPVNLTQ
ncbi:E3 ubiquitin-protein ligase TRIM21-like [Parambassis ranga]|uniref:E3 ubiquitin-protein ligase TRIM21-like n=1 Tax=Parambassis ranga TaxID=210632 RepID=A0A6P7HPP9_9TELE|nr:E3 ubiquitin-protein ligase TRIM21-like [Parambassis ranga]